jgi:hypothetical protein
LTAAATADLPDRMKIAKYSDHRDESAQAVGHDFEMLDHERALGG